MLLPCAFRGWLNIIFSIAEVVYYPPEQWISVRVSAVLCDLFSQLFIKSAGMADGGEYFETDWRSRLTMTTWSWMREHGFHRVMEQWKRRWLERENWRNQRNGPKRSARRMLRRNYRIFVLFWKSGLISDPVRTKINRSLAVLCFIVSPFASGACLQCNPSRRRTLYWVRFYVHRDIVSLQ